MALRKNSLNKSLYCRIDTVSVGKNRSLPCLDVGFYEIEPQQTEVLMSESPKNRMVFEIQREDTEWERFQTEFLSEVGENPLKVGYEYLKTLVYFSDFEDA